MKIGVVSDSHGKHKMIDWWLTLRPVRLKCGFLLVM